MSPRSPLVSVIIPFLDPPESMFREAINSVLAQTYRPAELILVDDGSDPALRIKLASAYTFPDLPIRWIQHDSGANEGISASRNLGISVSNGEYLTFIDADDVWLPNKLTRQVALLDTNPDVALLFGQTLYWNSDVESGADSLLNFIPWHGDSKLTKYAAPEYLLRILRGRAIVPSISNVILRRATFERSGGFEDEFRGPYEDQVLIAKICLRECVCAVPECWDKYRQHGASLTASVDLAGMVLARRRFLLWLESYCRAKQISDADVWEALAKNVWMNLADCRQATMPGFPTLRWLRKWKFRLEEAFLPATIRQRRWNKNRVGRLRSLD